MAAPTVIPFSGGVDQLVSSIDPNGNIFILGEVDLGGNIGIEAQIFQTNGNWTSAIVSPSGAQTPAIDTDSQGNAIAVWLQEDGMSTYDVMAAYYNQSTKAWSTGERISSVAIDAVSTIQIDFFGQSRAMAFWQVNNAGDFFIESAVFDRSTQTWDASTRTLDQQEELRNASFRVDDQGNALACWDTISATQVSSAVYNGGTQLWSFPTSEILSELSENSIPRISSPTDPGVFCWLLDPGSLYLTSQFVLARKPYFLPLTTLHLGSGSLDIFDSSRNFDLRVASSSSGTGFVLWQREEGGFSSVFGTTIDLAKNQAQPKSFFSSSSPVPLQLQLQANSSGEAIGAWSQIGEQFTLQRTIYNPNTSSWGAVEDLYTTNIAIGSSSLSLNDNGTNSIAWIEGSTGYLLKDQIGTLSKKKRGARRKR